MCNEERRLEVQSGIATARSTAKLLPHNPHKRCFALGQWWQTVDQTLNAYNTIHATILPSRYGLHSYLYTKWNEPVIVQYENTNTEKCIQCVHWVQTATNQARKLSWMLNDWGLMSFLWWVAQAVCFKQTALWLHHFDMLLSLLDWHLPGSSENMSQTCIVHCYSL